MIKQGAKVLFHAWRTVFRTCISQESNINQRREHPSVMVRPENPCNMQLVPHSLFPSVSGFDEKAAASRPHFMPFQVQYCSVSTNRLQATLGTEYLSTPEYAPLTA